jgi:excisionase family DNA binding protein
MASSMTEAFTLSELAQILPLSRSTIQSLTRKGVLPAERHGRKTYISRASVEAFLQRCMQLLRPQQQPQPIDVAIDDVADARQQQRFVLERPLAGRMLTADATVLDISEHGARIQHERPLRIGYEGRFSFEIPELRRVWVVRARIVWSRLSSDGYMSGIAVIENEQAMHDAVACLERTGAIVPDTTSLQRKQEAHRRKQAARAAMKRVPQTDVTQAQEQAALIRATMESLRRDPVAAQRWYSRARYAVAQESIRRLLPIAGRERDEALAIWEALDRRVDLRAICRIIAA